MLAPGFSWIFILLYGVANALRGSGIKWTPKWLLGIIMGLNTLLFFEVNGETGRVNNELIVVFIIWIGFLMSFSKGWTHMALHGWLDTKKKFPLITDFLNKHYKEMPIADKLGHKGSKTWGMMFMSIYALLLQFPQFIALSFYSDYSFQYTDILIGLAVVMKGVILFIVGAVFFKWVGEHSLRIFEFIYGCFLGGLLYLVIT
jgi:hypothetical protein